MLPQSTERYRMPVRLTGRRNTMAGIAPVTHNLRAGVVGEGTLKTFRSYDRNRILSWYPGGVGWVSCRWPPCRCGNHCMIWKYPNDQSCRPVLAPENGWYCGSHRIQRPSAHEIRIYRWPHTPLWHSLQFPNTSR